MSAGAGRRVKEGILRRYKKNLLGGKWKECKTVLYEDSTFIWYEDETESNAAGCIQLKQVAPYFAIGVYTTRLPNRPPMPSGSKIDHLMAFGTGASKDAKIYWFLAHSEQDFNDWMSGIVSTLPPPPQPQQMQPPPQQQMPPPGYNQGPQYGYNQGAQPPPYYSQAQGQGPLPPPPAWAQNMGSYPRPAAASAAPGTTVVVAPSSQASGSHWGTTAAGVGTGMLAGGLMGYALGSMMTPHWGWGGGYGYGGHGFGGYGPGGYYSDNDTTIINNYNTTNNDTNNFNDSGTTYDTGDTFDYGGGDAGGFDADVGGDDFDFGGDFGGDF